MDDFLDKLKDILYVFVDYFFMIVVVLAVTGVIAWRLDILFNKNYADVDEKDNEIVQNIDENKEKDNNVDIDENKDNINNDEINKEKENPVEIIHVEIPSGAVSTTIGNILAEKGLVPDSKSFVDKATELGKETKLKSGSFDIPSNLSIEGVIEIITK